MDAADRLRARATEGQLADYRLVPGRDPTYADCDLESRLANALEDRGIDRLYRHQVDAIEAVRDGDDVVLATPTASGKSLAYTVPAFERAMDHGGRTLYLGPQNALIADQAESLGDLREMESVEIDIDPEKESLVPRPDPGPETKQAAKAILDTANGALFDGYRDRADDSLLEALPEHARAKGAEIRRGLAADGMGTEPIADSEGEAQRDEQSVNNME